MTKLLVVQNNGSHYDIWDNGKCTSGYPNLKALLSNCFGVNEAMFLKYASDQKPIATEQLVWWKDE